MKHRVVSDEVLEVGGEKVSAESRSIRLVPAMNDTGDSLFTTIVNAIFSGDDNETVYEDAVNSGTHVIAAILAALGLYGIVLVSIFHDPKHWNRVKFYGCYIFGISLLTLYTLSTIYHSMGVFHPEMKGSLQKYDHMAIYLVIAGTYTALVCLLVIDKAKKSKLGVAVLILIWTLATVGIVVKSFINPNDIPGLYSNGYYLLMGWCILIVAKPVWEITHPRILFYTAMGGVFYTGGVGFLVWEQLQFNHGIWHLCVIGGSSTHYIAVMMALLEKYTIKDLWAHFVSITTPHLKRSDEHVKHD